MTCIVGMVDENKTVWMAGDSIGSNGYTKTIQTHPKVARIDDEMLIGYTSSFRMGDLLHYNLHLPVPKGGTDLDRWMRTAFIDAVRKCLADGGYRKKENEVESGGTFLVGIRGRLFTIHDEFQVTEDIRGYAAIGSSFDIALGSLYATMHLSRRLANQAPAPPEILGIALLAATDHAALVSAPFTCLNLEYTP